MTIAEPSSVRSPNTRNTYTTPVSALATHTAWANSPHPTTIGRKRKPMANETKIKCNHCGTIVVHDRRNNAGCNCDPDAPQWCYIQPDGKIQGFSQASWELLP